MIHIFHHCLCSLHVDGNYWKTGKTSRLIELRESFTLHKQEKSSDANKYFLSRNSGSVQHQTLYQSFVLSPYTANYRFMYSIYPLYSTIPPSP